MNHFCQQSSFVVVFLLSLAHPTFAMEKHSLDQARVALQWNEHEMTIEHRLHRIHLANELRTMADCGISRENLDEWYHRAAEAEYKLNNALIEDDCSKSQSSRQKVIRARARVFALHDEHLADHWKRRRDLLGTAAMLYQAEGQQDSAQELYAQIVGQERVEPSRQYAAREADRRDGYLSCKLSSPQPFPRYGDADSEVPFYEPAQEADAEECFIPDSNFTDDGLDEFEHRQNWHFPGSSQLNWQPLTCPTPFPQFGRVPSFESVETEEQKPKSRVTRSKTKLNGIVVESAPAPKRQKTHKLTPST